MIIPEDLQTLYGSAQAWRHERGSEPRFGSGTVEVLIERVAKLESENVALREALVMIYDKWEDGPNCYEASDGEAFDESGSSLGQAVKLSFEEENQILALIPAEKSRG